MGIWRDKNERKSGGVILEEVRDMFKTLAKGQKIVENRLDRVESRLDKVESDVSFIKTYVMRVDNELNNHEKRISALKNAAPQL